MKNNQGFTLIELIIVIVILGILAVTAAPRFLNMSGDAQRGVLQGVKAALESGSSMVYGKALIAGKQNAAIGGTDEVDTGILISFGYPKATETVLNLVIEAPEDWVFSSDAATGLVAEASPNTAGQIRLGPTAAALANDGCYVQYVTPTAAGDKPSITIVGDGC
jgi:MSHA pilin protein MshA